MFEPPGDRPLADYADFAAMERDGWSDVETARAYAEGFAAAAAQHVPRLVDAVRVRPDARVLDLCCGHGVVSAGLVAAGARVTGLDFSPAMLAMARDRVPAAEFIEGDAAALPFANASFDAVTIGLGVPHVPDPDRVLAEARRVLVSGGRIGFTCWLGPERSFAIRVVGEAIAAHGDPDVAMPDAPPNFAFAEDAVALPALARAEFTEAALDIIDSHWVLHEPGAVFDLFHCGTVRVGELLRRQPRERLPAIRAAVADAVRRDLGSDGPWRVPVPAALVSATAGDDARAHPSPTDSSTSPGRAWRRT